MGTFSKLLSFRLQKGIVSINGIKVRAATQVKFTS